MTISRLLLTSALITGLSACQPSETKSSDTSNQAKAAPINTDSDSWCISGGPIYTALDDAPKAASLAVKDGVIVGVSRKNEAADWCAELAGTDAQTLNLAGKALYPGLTDSHGHFLGIGLREMVINLDTALSVSDVQKQVLVAVANTPKGETIYGRGWIETHWPEKRFPNKTDLDSIAPDNPVILTRADGHAAVVNTAALNAVNITAETEVPFGGDILKDETGQPTGMLIDMAMDLVGSLMPKLTVERKAEAYKKASEVYASRGWTNIHSMSVGMNNLDLQSQMAADGDIKLRVYNSADIRNLGDISTVHDFKSTDLISARAIKLYSDGALGSRGAALLAPYDDDPGNKGLLMTNKETIMPILVEALKKGIQVNTHAIGDRANHMLLDWYEEAFADVPVSARAVAAPRWRVEHAQILTLEDINRFQALGIIPSMQPSHAIGDLHFAFDRIGKERLAGGYAWRSLIDSGSIIAGGSDAPVEVGDPRIEFYAAVTRKDLKGYSDENWYDNQKVTRQEALKMFTIWPAYASFEEDLTGSIEVGKAADFTVFDTDIMTADPKDILSANVEYTIVNGNAVYARK